MRLADGMMMVGKTENFPIYMIFGPASDLHTHIVITDQSLYINQFSLYEQGLILEVFII